MSVLRFFILFLTAVTCRAAPKSRNGIGDQCGSPPTVLFGDIINIRKMSYKSNEFVEYECQRFYLLKGDKIVRCLNGFWGKAPVCLEPCIAYEKSMEENNIQLKRIWNTKKLYTTQGDSVEFVCKYGYDAPPNTSMKVTCENGKLEYPKCFRRGRCLFLKAHIENADLLNLQSVYLEGEEVNFRCKSPFQTQDGKTSGIRTCLPNGEFTTAKCSKPCTVPQLLHGKYTPNKKELSNGAYLQYECDKGYMTEKRRLFATVQCLDEEWSDIPKCIAITCRHGYLSYKDKDVINYTCSRGRRPKSDLVQCFNYGWGPPRICQGQKPDEPDATNPPLEDSEKEEKRKKCPIAYNLRNTEIIDLKEAYYSNDEVTMKCNKGYRMYGSATIRCIDGKWEQPPECYEIGDQCGPPPTIQFGDTIENRKISYKPDEFVEYQCPIYHVFKGEKIVRCLNGVWGEAPVCLEPCTAKENSMDENNIQLKFLGEKKKYLTHGDQIEFNCIFGYEALPETQMRITCEHGKLEYPKCLRKGFCILQLSEMIANNIHYNVSTVVERGQTITFQCDEEMIPEKRLEATCTLGKIQYPKCTAANFSALLITPYEAWRVAELKAGLCTWIRWSAYDFTCAQCGKPPKIENTFLQGDWDVKNYPPGSTATYSCHPGYSPLGRIRRACVGGEWQVLSKGLCRKKSCGHPGEISFGTFELKNGYEFVFGAEVEYYCDEGYQMISKYNTRICAADGWTNFLPHCEARLCPPVMDDSVRVITSVADDEFSMGHVINLQCKNPKHTLRGPSQIYCTEHGTWNVDPPTCKESCTIQDIDMGKNNIHLKNNRGLHVKDNEDVHFQCNYGYNILDPAKLTIKCNNGVLEYPTCQKIAMKPCGRPPQIRYGHITEPVNDTYDSGSSVTYKCQPYFAVYGQELIQCQDGIWGKPPVCLGFLDKQTQVPQKTEKKICGRPPQIQHGEFSTAVNDSYKSGSFVTYKCQKFFTIQGKKKIQCQDGIWDDSPVCLAKKTCGRPPQVLHGEIATTIKDTYDSGSSVTYQCQKYFRIHGHKVIKCQDGKWGKQPVCLEPCTTSETHMQENHITLIWKNGNNNHCIRSDENENYAKKCYVKHNQIIKFACLPGYTIYNKMELISMCSKGKLSYPRCI